MKHSITLVQPTTGTLVDTIYEPADYRDAFLVPSTDDGFESVADFATAYFLHQPRWLSEYRFSFLKRHDGVIEASTAVKYRWQRMSRLYFGLVKPIHRRFVPISLRGAVSNMQMVAA